MRPDHEHLQRVPVAERLVARPLVVLIFCLLPGVVLVKIAALAQPDLTSDELGTAAAVPLVVLYVMIRLIVALSTPPSEEQIEHRESMQRRLPGPCRLLVDFQAVAIVFAAVGVLSAPLYAWLDMPWAWAAALKASGVLLGIAAFAIVTCAALLAVFQNHRRRGIVWAVSMFVELLWLRLGDWSNSAKNIFRSHTALAPF